LKSDDNLVEMGVSGGDFGGGEGVNGVVQMTVEGRNRFVWYLGHLFTLV
jgi:hypothetical protein